MNPGPVPSSRSGVKKYFKIPRTKPRILILLVLTLFVIAGLFGIWTKWLSDDNSTKTVDSAIPRSIKDLESETDKSTNQLVDKKDYTSYQVVQSALITRYLGSKDINSAERVLKEVFNNVPNDKVNSTTYSAALRIQLAKNDKEGIKNAELVLIDAYKKEGDTKSAATVEQDLKTRQ